MSLIKCPTGCGRSRRRDHLMCPVCWRGVPRELQDRVYRTWREWQKHPGDAVRMQAWSDARDAAIASVP